LRGEMDDAQAVADMTARFQALVDIWTKARAT
jgi:myo-inositol catabolism protein IolC